jgi:hypothetical protein
MNQPLQAPDAPAEQPLRNQDRVTRLDQCGDVLSITELASVIGLSVRSIDAQERAGTFPIRRIDYGLVGRKHLPRKYAKVAVQRFFERRSR